MLRVGWIVTVDNRLTWIDEHAFADIGIHVAQGDGYVSSSFRANPVLPTYLGLGFRLFGQSYVAARFGQSIGGALTCVLLYRTGAVLVSPAVEILSGLLLAVYPSHVYLAGVLICRFVAAFFCALSIYFAALALRARGQLGLAWR